MIRVLVADDHAIVRDGLLMLFGGLDGTTVVGAVETAEQAVRASVELRPDIVLMDLALPVMGGVEASRRIARSAPESRVLVLTSHDDDASLRAAIDAGARGYLVKTSGLGEIATAIESVHRGQLVFGGTVAGDAVRLLRSAPPQRAFPALTGREHEMLELLASGRSNAQIAAALGVTEKTVGNTLSRVFLKLGVARRTEAVLLARSAGLGSDPAR